MTSDVRKPFFIMSRKIPVSRFWQTSAIEEKAAEK